MSRELAVPASGPLAELLNAADGGPTLPPVGGDAFTQRVMEEGITDGGDDDSPPAIHLSGGTGGIRDLGEIQMRRNRQRTMARMGPPPQPPRPTYQPSPSWEQPVQVPQMPMMPQMMPQVQQGLQIFGVDFRQHAIVTNHGVIALPSDAGDKIYKAAAAAVREYFMDSMRQSMSMYPTAKPKRRKRKASGGTKRGAQVPSVPKE